MDHATLVPLFEIEEEVPPPRPSPRRPEVAVEGPLGELVGEWLEEYPASSAVAYLSDLERYCSWCDPQGIDPLAARRADLARYLAEDTSSVAPATLARRASAISSFYSYLAATGKIATSPAQGLRRPRRRPNPPVGLDPTELARLGEAAEASGATPWCLILVLSVMGLRVSEACGLCVGDLTVASGTYRLRVQRKGGIPQVLEVPSAVGEVLFDLARSRPPGAPLLCGPRGGWLSRRQAQRIVASLAEEAGIDHHVHPHLLRHTFVSLALMSGVPLVAVASAAGHRDRATTLYYAEALSAREGRAPEAVIDCMRKASTTREGTGARLDGAGEMGEGASGGAADLTSDRVR